MRHREFLVAMIGLTAWVAEQPFSTLLFPFTAYE
jgi:hypothetical protein